MHLSSPAPRLEISQMALGYLSWGVFAYLMTLGKGNHQARGWFFTGQIVMLAAEVAIVMAPGGEGVLPSWLFPGMAEYEVKSFFSFYLSVTFAGLRAARVA